MRLSVLDCLFPVKRVAVRLLDGADVRGAAIARFYFLFCFCALFYAYIGSITVYLIRGKIFLIFGSPLERPHVLFVTFTIILLMVSGYYLAMRLREVYSPLSIFYLKLAAVFCFLSIWPTFSNIKILMSLVRDFSFDPPLARVDTFIHGGIDPWQLYLPLLRIFEFDKIDLTYLSTWFFIAFLLPIYILLFESNLKLRVQFFTVYMIVWIGIGNVLAFAFLSAGPVYYDKVTGDLLRFAEWRSTLHSLGFNDSIAPRIQEALWNTYSHAGYQLGGGISAFPSVHVGVAMLAALYVWHKLGHFGIIALLYPLLIQVFSVLLGWHYALDGYVSIVIVTLVWYFVGQRFDRAGTESEAQRTHPSASLNLRPVQFDGSPPPHSHRE